MLRGSDLEDACGWEAAGEVMLLFAVPTVVGGWGVSKSFRG